MGQVDEEGIQSLRRKNMNKTLSELYQYSRGTAREMYNRIRILRKMELTRIEEAQTDATISIPNHMLKQASRKLEGRKSKTLVVCLNLSYLECVWVVFVARVISAVVRKKGPVWPLFVLPSKIRLARSQGQMLSIPSIFQTSGCLHKLIGRRR